MRGDLDLWGVDKFDGATVTLVGQIVCTDAGRWPVQREFNRRMKIRFQELGVDLAWPTQTRTRGRRGPRQANERSRQGRRGGIALERRAGLNSTPG